MKYCLNCKRYFTEDFSFCTQCGGSFNVRYCARRLHLNPISAHYCKLCGTSDMSEPNTPSREGDEGGRRFPLLFLAAVVVVLTALLVVLTSLYAMDALPPAFVFLAMIIVAVLLAGFRRSVS